MITKDVLDILSPSIKSEVIKYDDGGKLQEIRLKANKPLIFISNNKEIKTSYTTKLEDIKMIIQKIRRTQSWNLWYLRIRRKLS